MSDQTTRNTTIRRFWLSWEEKSDDHRPLTYPPNEAIIGWWCSGYGDDYATIVAWVEAVDEDAARAAVAKDWPESASSEWRFCEEVERGWRPGDRFPLSTWMQERE